MSLKGEVQIKIIKYAGQANKIPIWLNNTNTGHFP